MRIGDILPLRALGTPSAKCQQHLLLSPDMAVNVVGLKPGVDLGRSASGIVDAIPIPKGG